MQQAEFFVFHRELKSTNEQEDKSEIVIVDCVIKFIRCAKSKIAKSKNNHS